VATSDSTSSSTLGSLDWPRLMLIRPNWPPVMNAVNGLIDCTTSPDSGSLKVGMGGSFLVSAQDTRRGSPAGRLYWWLSGLCRTLSLCAAVIAESDPALHDGFRQHDGKTSCAPSPLKSTLRRP